MITKTGMPEICPDCKAINYVYTGGIITDNAVSVRCWQCKHGWIVLESENRADINNALVVNGEPNPR